MAITQGDEHDVKDSVMLTEDEFEERHPHSMHDPDVHTDVSETPPAHGQAMVWDEVTEKYVPQSVTPVSLSGLVFISTGELVYVLTTVTGGKGELVTIS